MDLLSTITRESERCVACGLCLPHCPTYRKTQNEAESPRGRIALMRTLATGGLALTPNLVAHLDRCLACRACERVCPSNVGYGDLIRAARAVILERQPTLLRARWRERIARRLLAPETATAPSRARGPRLGPIGETGGVLRAFLRFYQRSGLRSLARASGLLKLFGLSSMDNELPPLSSGAPWQTRYPASGVKRGTVALFTGCVSSLTDRPTLDAAIRVLNRLGYDVRVPEGQACCGALHQHSGDAGRARALASRNLAAFAEAATGASLHRGPRLDPIGDERFDAIVGVATGCTATLAEYGHDLGTDMAKRFSGRVMDIAAFLMEISAASDLPLKPLPKRIAVHDPCTATNVLRSADKVYALLRRIPGAEVRPLPENTVCCGAAGAYHLRQPELAERLRADKVAHIKRLAPDVLVSSNVGCSLFLAAGLREAGVNVEVLHPVALLARQMQD